MGDTESFRVAVASRALGLLPSQINHDVASKLAARGQPRIVRERVIAFELILIGVVAGAVCGWVLCVVTLGQRRR